MVHGKNTPTWVLDTPRNSRSQELESLKRWQGSWYIAGLRKKVSILVSMWLKEARFFVAVLAPEEEKRKKLLRGGN